MPPKSYPPAIHRPSLSPPQPPSAPEKQKPPLLALLVIAGVIWLLITGNVNQSRRPTRTELEQKNAQLIQENLYLHNQIDQLQHQLMGVYSAQ